MTPIIYMINVQGNKANIYLQRSLTWAREHGSLIVFFFFLQPDNKLFSILLLI